MPFIPLGVFRVQFRQPPSEIMALNAFQALFIRIPEGVGLFVVEHEGIVIGPSGRGQSQDPAVDFAAVHSRQVGQRSVAHGNRGVADDGIGDFVPGEFSD